PLRRSTGRGARKRGSAVIDIFLTAATIWAEFCQAPSTSSEYSSNTRMPLSRGASRTSHCDNGACLAGCLYVTWEGIPMKLATVLLAVCLAVAPCAYGQENALDLRQAALPEAYLVVYGEHNPERAYQT